VLISTRIRASATNRRPSNCGHCGAELAEGRGRVWWDRFGKAHCTCLDPSVCKARTTPPRTPRAELERAVVAVDEAGFLDMDVEVLVARVLGLAPLDDGLRDLMLSAETEAALSASLPPWVPDPRAGRLQRREAASDLAPPVRPRAPARRPGAARREWMACPTCGAVAVCYSDVLGVQHWQCMTCLGAGRPSCWDTCTTCGHRTEDLVAPWVCPGCGRDRRPVPATRPVYPEAVGERPGPVPVGGRRVAPRARREKNQVVQHRGIVGS